MQSKHKLTAVALEWYDSVIFSLAVIMLLFVFVLRVSTVYQHSMEPTLFEKERVTIQSMLYTPKKGDVVVIDGYIEYGKPLVKRVIATEGDELMIDTTEGKVYVNGTELDEPYLGSCTYRGGDWAYPVTVPQGMVFVMGDNRANSRDSRDTEIGFVDNRDILGRVLFRIYPFNKLGAVK